MADSPGALLPGSTPETASPTLLKGLLTAQGIALVVAGVWVVSKLRKKTRKNPRRRRH